MDLKNVSWTKIGLVALFALVILTSALSSNFLKNEQIVMAYYDDKLPKNNMTLQESVVEKMNAQGSASTPAAQAIRYKANSTGASIANLVTSQFKESGNKVNVHFNYPMPVILTNEEKFELDAAIKKAQTKKKIILEWYAQRSKELTMRGICGYCEVTSNRSKIDDLSTKAVIFWYRDIHSSTMPFPLTRRTDQLHVWQTGEAPPSLLFLHRRYFHFEEKYRFNMTQSFRRDAGIYHPYGSASAILAKKISQGYNMNLTKVLDGKSRVAVAVMSNCHSIPGANIRLQFVRDLKADGLNVQTLGKCFSYQTYQKQDALNFNKLLKTYKFYLAFENSYHCRDYITEKFFQNGLEAGSIPIVWGAMKEDYDAVAPPGSYIYADAFNTTKDLIQYIHFLDKNDSAYLEYFKWYQIPVKDFPDYGRQIRYCQLCRILHGINVDDIYHPEYNASTPERPRVSDELSPRTVKSLYNWFYKAENRDCLKSPSRFYHDNLSLPAKTLDGRP